MRLHHFTKIATTILSISTMLFLGVGTAFAGPCTYHTRDAQGHFTPGERPELDFGRGVPFCQDMPTDASCTNLCAGAANTVLTDCTYHSGAASCEVVKNQFIQQATIQLQQQQQQEAQRAALDQQQRTEDAGKCMCSLTDPLAPLQPLDGATPDTCYDREDLANGGLHNCQWVLNENVQATGDKSVQDLLDANSNPLEVYRGNIAQLNKLKANSTQAFIGLVIKTATGIMGTIALVMIIYGGLLWMTSMGNSSQTEKAQNVLFYGALGIFVIFGSYAIITFIFSAASPTLTK